MHLHRRNLSKRMPCRACEDREDACNPRFAMLAVPARTKGCLQPTFYSACGVGSEDKDACHTQSSGTGNEDKDAWKTRVCAAAGTGKRGSLASSSSSQAPQVLENVGCCHPPLRCRHRRHGKTWVADILLFVAGTAGTGGRRLTRAAALSEPGAATPARREWSAGAAAAPLAAPQGPPASRIGAGSRCRNRTPHPRR